MINDVKNEILLFHMFFFQCSETVSKCLVPPFYYPISNFKKITVYRVLFHEISLPLCRIEETLSKTY